MIETTFFVSRIVENLGMGNFQITDYYCKAFDGVPTTYLTSVDNISVIEGQLIPDANIPAVGEIVFSECIGTSLHDYKYVADNTVTVEITPGSATCCTFNTADFNLSVTQDDGSSNGTVSITSSTVLTENYEYSLNSGAWIPGTAGATVITGITGSNSTGQSLRIRLLGGTSCFGTFNFNVPLLTVVQPPFAFVLTSPAQFMPVFYPIAYSAQFNGNIVLITQSGGNTVIETTDGGLQNYLTTLPNVRIYGSESYNGVYKILSKLSATQYVIAAPYTSPQSVSICPSDKQIFFLYCERGLNQMTKIAELAIAASATGLYTIRVEGFLQSEFILNPPVEGDEITLGRKYYLSARDFGINSTTTTAVYSAVPSLMNFLEDLTPLGAAPLNFINDQTQKGLPVLFSYLNTATGRVVNVISSKETDIISTNDINLVALPCNKYSIQWLKVAGNINGPLASVPALPSWIVANVVANQVNLEIDTCGGDGGDYSGDDYLSLDYLVANFNEITGCYEFDFSDNDGPLFTLSICIYPIQQPAVEICEKDVYNIAWINREGGWSSYAFGKDRGDKSRKQLGYDVGGSKDYKRNGELKKAEVQDVYQNASVSFSNKNQREMIFIGSLRRSVQAYLFNEDTRNWDIPIFIDIESFPTYSLPFNQAQDGNGSFTFRYSDEIRVQRQ